METVMDSLNIHWLENAYFWITLIPSALLFVMFILGFDHEFDFDTDIHGDFDVGGIDVPSEPGKLGIRLIMSFMIGFGLFGFLAVNLKWPIPHVLSAMMGGSAFWYLMYQFMKLIFKQQANTQVASRTLVGKIGTVTHRITGDNVGEIKVKDPATGLTIDLRAVAPDIKKMIKPGAEVIINSVVDGKANVKLKED
jgi:membrane protein implicated in regulation of membrane protease activity